MSICSETLELFENFIGEFKDTSNSYAVRKTKMIKTADGSIAKVIMRRDEDYADEGYTQYPSEPSCAHRGQAIGWLGNYRYRTARPDVSDSQRKAYRKEMLAGMRDDMKTNLAATRDFDATMDQSFKNLMSKRKQRKHESATAVDEGFTNHDWDSKPLDQKEYRRLARRDDNYLKKHGKPRIGPQIASRNVVKAFQDFPDRDRAGIHTPMVASSGVRDMIKRNLMAARESTAVSDRDLEDMHPPIRTVKGVRRIDPAALDFANKDQRQCESRNKRVDMSSYLDHETGDFNWRQAYKDHVPQPRREVSAEQERRAVLAKMDDGTWHKSLPGLAGRRARNGYPSGYSRNESYIDERAHPKNITDADGTVTHHSYSVPIARRYKDGRVELNKDTYNYSTTTAKHRNQFLGHDSKELARRIKSGHYTFGKF